MASDLASLPGEELIRLLKEPATRVQAYQELDLRSDPAAEPDLGTFLNTHRNPEVVICQQEDGLPLYVVLSDSLSYIGEKSDEPPPEPIPLAPDEIARRRDLLIEVFASDGHKMNPLPCNDNVLDGLLTDMNADGFVERAESIAFRVEGVKHVNVLKVEHLANPVRGMLAVLYDWGEHEDWDFAFSDRNRDGLIEIDFGPLTLSGVKPKVTFRWDRYTQSYVQEGSSDHLLVLNPSVDCCSGPGLSATIPPFSADPDAARDVDLLFLRHGELPRFTHRQISANTTPYRPVNLASLSNEEVFRYMGPGKDFLDLEIQETPRTSIPVDFWIADPSEAALHLADANRKAGHRSRYQLVLKANDSIPGSGALSLVEGGAHWDKTYSYFLKAGKDNSYVALAATSGVYQRDGDPSYEPPAYDIRICEIPNKAAYQALAVLWRLHQIRTDPPGKMGDRDIFGSTGDGNGTVQLFLPGSRDAQFTASGDIGVSVAERWDSSFEEEEYIGIVSKFFESALSEIAKTCWAETTKHPKELYPAVRKMLESFSPDQSLVTYVSADYAVQAAGDLGFTDLRPRVESILGVLPQPAAPLRCEEDVWKEVEAENASFKSLVPSAGDLTKMADQMDSSMSRSKALLQEWEALDMGASTDCNIRDLRNSIAVALRQLADRDDGGALQTWIEDRDPGWRWALWRLAQIDPLRAAVIFEAFLTSADEDRTRAEILETLGRLQPARARSLATQMLDPAHAEVYVAAFFRLGREDQDRRIEVLLQLAVSDQTDYSTRYEILKRIVPAEAPNLFKSRMVDDALQAIVLEQPAQDYESLQAEAVHALVLRSGARAADILIGALEHPAGYSAMDMLRDAEDLYPFLQKSQRDRLQKVMQGYMDQHSGAINEIAAMAWVLDLREFQSQLESLATSGPEEFEAEACSQWGQEESEDVVRCHGARTVVALWNEKSALTRFKMMISWYVSRPYDFDWLDNTVFQYRWATLETRLKSELKRMSPSQKMEARAFLNWCESAHPFEKYEIDYEPDRIQLFQALRQ